MLVHIYIIQRMGSHKAALFRKGYGVKPTRSYVNMALINLNPDYTMGISMNDYEVGSPFMQNVQSSFI